MLLSNLSDGPCETKDVIVENETILRKLAELLILHVYSYIAIATNFLTKYYFLNTATSTHQCSDTRCIHLYCKTSH